MSLKPVTLVVWGGGIAVLVAFFYYAFAPRPVPVDMARVIRSDMQITIDADGITRIRDVFEVAAPVSGLALRSPVHVGDPVVIDKTVVAVVQPVQPGLLDARSRIQAEAALREAEAAVHVAETRITKAEADLTYATSQFDRARTLTDRGVASLSQLEDAAQLLAVQKAALEATRSQWEMSVGAMERARAALLEPSPTLGSQAPDSCCIELLAPSSGTVLNIENESERPVMAGATLLSIGRPDDLEIVSDLLSSDAVRVHPGAAATLERWGGEGALKAMVREVEPSGFTKISALGIEEQRVNVILDLIDPPEDRARLGDGFSVFVRIVEWSKAGVLQVPLSALFRHQDGWAVFTISGNKAVLTPITTGRRNGRFAEVLEGVDESMQIITHPSDRISDGISVVDREKL